MFSLEGSPELSNTVDQVVIAKTDFENSGRCNIVDVTCCNVVDKGRLLRSFPCRFVYELFKLIRTVDLLHVLAWIIQTGHI